jgi:hypothetical protein
VDEPTATLARALADSRTLEGPYATLYSDSISMALLSPADGALRRVE